MKSGKWNSSKPNRSLEALCHHGNSGNVDVTPSLPMECPPVDAAWEFGPLAPGEPDTRYFTTDGTNCDGSQEDHRRYGRMPPRRRTRGIRFVDPTEHPGDSLGSWQTAATRCIVSRLFLSRAVRDAQVLGADEEPSGDGDARVCHASLSASSRSNHHSTEAHPRHGHWTVTRIVCDEIWLSIATHFFHAREKVFLGEHIGLLLFAPPNGSEECSPSYETGNVLTVNRTNDAT
jgi:hypothetical protein